MAAPSRCTLLVIGASPSADARPDREVNEIIATIRGERASSWGDDAVHSVLAASGKLLKENLAQRLPRVLHLSCHHERNEKKNAAEPFPSPIGQFRLDGGDGSVAEYFSDVQLADAIRDAYGDTSRGQLQLVFLNACSTFEVAERLVLTQVVPASIGTTTAVVDLDARVFSSALYTSMACGKPVAEAFVEAKKVMIPHVKRLKIEEAGLEPDAAEALARDTSETFVLFPKVCGGGDSREGSQVAN